MSQPAFNFASSERISGFGPTVWLEYSPLAARCNAINLGQGFPDFEAPDFILQAAQNAIGNHINQYARQAGHPRLVNALGKRFSPLLGVTLDPFANFLVTVGASEAIALTFQALVNPGDEVILIEPFFDIYVGSIQLAGGVVKYISLKTQNTDSENLLASDWKLDLEELKRTITPKTKVLLINNPQNPLGKVWSRDELEAIAQIVSEHPNLVVISDEVYEWMVFDNLKHERFATIPGMWDRTITIGSAGKTFSVTGWKIGWAIAPANIIKALCLVHQFNAFTVAAPLQEAVAIGFEQADAHNYFPLYKEMFENKRNKLVKTLKENGFKPIVPQGSYFVMADISSIKLEGDAGKTKTVTGMNLHLNDWNVCRYLTTDIGVAAIPGTAFYSTEHMHECNNLVRFTFCKRDEVLEEAEKRLHKLTHPTTAP